VEVAFACCAFAEKAYGDSWDGVRVLDVLHLEGVGCAGGMGDLRGEGGADGMDVEFFGTIMNGHVASEAVVSGICEELVHKGSEGEAALQVDARFTVLAENNVGGREGASGADGYALLACRDLCKSVLTASAVLVHGTHHIEAQPALSLCFEHEEVHGAHYVWSAAISWGACADERVTIFLYSATASSSVVSTPTSLSMTSPYWSMTRNVAMAGSSAGWRKARVLVKALLSAPGNKTLHAVSRRHRGVRGRSVTSPRWPLMPPPGAGA